MEIFLLKALLNSVTQYFQLSSQESINSELAQRYYKKAEDILKLLKPILDAILGSELASNEVLNKYFEELGNAVAELRELFESWQPMMSKVYFVIQVEEIILRIQSSAIDILQSLQYNNEELPDELSSASLEHCVQKINHIGDGKTSSFIREAARDLVDGAELNSETLVKIAESLSLKSNYEILIEAVALEKLKETAEQAEKTDEAEEIDQLIALVTGMHDRLIMIKQSQSSSPIPIPPDFCCPLSLELMTDPVIVASGQTYERAFIKQWLELGLTVCPKTRQILAHTNLIPNYTVKALIANWCESNNVKLPDPTKSMSLNQPSPLLVRSETGKPNDLNFRSNRPMSPESGRRTGSPARNLAVSSGVRREGTTPLHPRSTSDGSMSSVSGNGHGLDIGRLSLETSEENIANLEERIRDSLGQTSASSTRKDLSNALVADELVSTSHKRAASASSGYATANSPSQVSGDRNGSWQAQAHMKGHSSDVSSESKSDAADSASMPVRPREAEFPPRLVEARPRNQMIWRRPSDRFVPKIVPSPAVESRNDLSGVESQVKKLVEDLKSDSLETQREATAELRVLARHDMDNRVVIANCGAVNLLVSLLRSSDTQIQENAVTALLNLSINDNNKIAIANADSIEPLIHVLKTGSPEAKENSAATLFSLSVIEDNKVKIGRSGAIGPLVDLLGNGTPRGKKDAATALFNLSIFHENKARIVQAGAVKYLVDLMDPAAGMVDKAVAVLANLATIQEGRAEIGQQGGIPVLVEVVELGSGRGKENAAAALLQLCTNSNKHCSMVLQEGAVPPLVALSQSGTPRAKEKAQSLLSYFRNQRHGGAPRA